MEISKKNQNYFGRLRVTNSEANLGAKMYDKLVRRFDYEDYDGFLLIASHNRG